MKPVNYLDVIAHTTDKLSHNGVFLTVAGETPNTMTIGWGSVGYCWGKPVFTVVVRPQRHTYEMLKKAGEFTVSVPTVNALKAELAYAGSASGANENKFEGHGLTAVPAQQVGAPIIAECGLHFECKVRLVQDMTPDRMDPVVAGKIYPANDFHTMFFGEIVACYSTDE